MALHQQAPYPPGFYLACTPDVDLSKAFRHNADGSWSCVVPVTLEHPKGRIQVTPGSTFTRGSRFMGIDVAEWLDQAIVSYARPKAD
jgi:hypothetical protein